MHYKRIYEFLRRLVEGKQRKGGISPRLMWEEDTIEAKEIIAIMEEAALKMWDWAINEQDEP